MATSPGDSGGMNGFDPDLLSYADSPSLGGSPTSLAVTPCKIPVMTENGWFLVKKSSIAHANDVTPVPRMKNVALVTAGLIIRECLSSFTLTGSSRWIFSSIA